MCCVRYFLQIFYFFTKWSPFKNYEKCFLFHLKSCFRSLDIKVFVFPSSLRFLPVSHCFKGCSKKNLPVYDVINFLNKNLITHFVWYFEKEKRYGIETLPIVRVLNKEHFYQKIMQKKVYQKLVPDSFLILVNITKLPLNARNSF